MEGVVYFNDEATIQTLQELRDSQRFSKEIIDNYLEIVRKRMARSGFEVRHPIFSVEMSEPEKEVRFCALIGGTSLEDVMRVRSHVIISICLDEVVVAIYLYKYSSDSIFRHRIRSLLSSVAKWSPENEEIAKLVQSFEKEFSKPVTQKSGPRPEGDRIGSQADDGKTRPSSEEDLYFLKWLLIPIIVVGVLVTLWFKRSGS